jgi:hypothetical protein
VDETIPVPEQYHLYYWVYPYGQTVVVRDTVSIDTAIKSANQIVYFNLMKFFPLGFLVTDRGDFISPRKFGNFNNTKPSEFHDVSIDLTEVQDANFPEHTTDTRATMFGSTGGAGAVAHRRRKGRMR